jgi:hypothetical protein
LAGSVDQLQTQGQRFAEDPLLARFVQRHDFAHTRDPRGGARKASRRSIT